MVLGVETATILQIAGIVVPVAVTLATLVGRWFFRQNRAQAQAVAELTKRVNRVHHWFDEHSDVAQAGGGTLPSRVQKSEDGLEVALDQLAEIERQLQSWENGN